MGKSVLMVGFHFPPSALSSGHLRLLAFAKYLPEFGWDPMVLSATPCAYEQVDPDSVHSIPESCRVYRAIALDAKRHLAIHGKYPSVLAQPDRWSSWWPAAVWRGLRLIRRHRPTAIWSTYPIMTSHCVAYTLNRLTGVPWIADFRDPVAGSVAGKDTRTVRSQTRWECRVTDHAAYTVFTAPGAKRECGNRHPALMASGRLTVIENGYDEALFAGIHDASSRTDHRQLVLVHSGVLYPEGRNPAGFFEALAQLRSAGDIGDDNLKVILRASGSEAQYAREVQRLGLGGIVTLEPQVSGRDALLEQAAADALLLFQGTLYDRHIPAKVYEYLRIGRPIFGLVGKDGDTAALLRDTGGAQLVPLDDVDAIRSGLRDFLAALRIGTAPRVRPDAVAGYSRREGTALLAQLLDRAAGDQP